VLNRGLHAHLGSACTARAEGSAAEIENGESDPQTLAHRPKDVLLRHEHILEGQPAGRRSPDAQLLHALFDDLEARHVRRDQEGGDLLLFVFASARRASHHGEHLGDATVGDPALLAVENVALAVGRGRRGRLHVAGVGAGLWLGQREGRELIALHQRRQPTALLLVRPKQDQRANADAVVGIDEDGRARAVAANYLHDARICQLRQVSSAELRRSRHAQDANAAEAGDVFRRNCSVAVDGPGVEVFVNVFADFGKRPVGFGALVRRDLRVRE
jgi:hypothetical protein